MRRLSGIRKPFDKLRDRGGALRDRVDRYKDERNKDLCNRAWLCGVAAGAAVFH